MSDTNLGPDFGENEGPAPVCAKDLKRYFYLIAIVAIVVVIGAVIWRESSGGGIKLSTLLAQFDNTHVANAPAGGAVQPGTPVAGGAVSAGPMAVAAPMVVAAPLIAAPMTGGGGVALPTGDVRPSQPGMFSNVVAVLRNSVVSVTASSGGGAAVPDPAAMLGGGVDGQMRFASPVTRAVENIGSGVVVRNDGYILTNFHVVRGANAVFVTVQDDFGSSRYAADIIKMDDAMDLALLKVAPKAPLSPAVLGNSDQVNVADEVIAIGSPFGLDMTVSRGIVSAKRKSMVIEGVTHTNLLQTDAAINQGNSGGPLVGTNGAVIGINTAIYTPNGAFAGIGFAVSSNQARRFVLDEIGTLPGATIEGPSFGLVAFPSVNPAAFPMQVAPMQIAMPQQTQRVGVGAAGPPIAAGAPAPHTDGRENMDCAMCHEIIGGAAPGRQATNPVGMGMRGGMLTVAAPAGPQGPPINAGDPAPHTDGREKMNCAMCHQIIGGAPTGQIPTGQIPTGMTVAAPVGVPPPIPRGTVSPHTDGRQNMDCAMCHQILPAAPGVTGLPVAVPGYQFATPPGSLAMNVVAPQGQAKGGQTVMGATLTAMSPTLSQQLAQPVGRGVFVGAVVPGSPAALADLKAGDVLLKVDGRPVGTPQEVMSLLAAAAPGQSVRLGVLHEGEVRGSQIVVGATGMTAAVGAGMVAQQQMPQQQMPQQMPQQMNAAPAKPRVPNEFNWLGLEIETFRTVQPVAGVDMTGMPQGAVVNKGAMVGEVMLGSRAELAGLKRNDLIVEVNNRPVATAAHLDAAIKSATASAMPIVVKVNRNGQEFVAVL